MPVKFERMANEPILIATLYSPVTQDDVHQVYRVSAQMADELGGRVYRISDVGVTDMSFGDLVEVMADAAEGQPGSPADNRIGVALVGNSDSFRIYSEGFTQEHYGRRNVPLFATFDAALAHVREEMIADRVT